MSKVKLDAPVVEVEQQQAVKCDKDAPFFDLDKMMARIQSTSVHSPLLVDEKHPVPKTPSVFDRLVKWSIELDKLDLEYEVKDDSSGTKSEPVFHISGIDNTRLALILDTMHVNSKWHKHFRVAK